MQVRNTGFALVLLENFSATKTNIKHICEVWSWKKMLAGDCHRVGRCRGSGEYYVRHHAVWARRVRDGQDGRADWGETIWGVFFHRGYNQWGWCVYSTPPACQRFINYQRKLCCKATIKLKHIICLGFVITAGVEHTDHVSFTFVLEVKSCS